MEDKRIQLTKEVDAVLKKYHTKGVFMVVLLEGTIPGKQYDDGFLLRGSGEELVAAVNNASHYDQSIHTFLDNLLAAHMPKIMESVAKEKLAN